MTAANLRLGLQIFLELSTISESSFYKDQTL